MSASLVGSEMCIRDSFVVTVEFSERNDAEPPGRGLLGRSLRSFSGQCNSCLLYTSDAADDM
eukprot:4652971-Alexandrium_andersonii.AAC.1